MPPNAPDLRVMHVMEATAGGSRKFLRYLVCGLRAAGVQVDLVLSTRATEPDFAQDLRMFTDLGCWVKPLTMRKSPGPWDLAVLRTLARIMRERRPQIVHTHAAKAGILGRLAARHVDRAIRTIHTPHSWYFQRLTGLSMRSALSLERSLSRRTDRLLCIADVERQIALAHDLIPADRITVAPNGLPAAFAASLHPRHAVRAELQIPDDAIAIAVMSRLVSRKGLDLLPPALAAVPPDLRRRLHLYINGSGPLRAQLESQVRAHALRAQVHFLGYRPAAERDWLGYDIGILPSHYEGLAYSLLETLAAGRPLIATDVPGNRLDRPANPIRYVPRDDPAALAAAIAELAADPVRRAELGHRSEAWVNLHFTLEGQLATILQTYRDVVTHR